jgi:hypothetical protein
MNRSIIGFHYSVGGNKNGVGEFMKKLNTAEIPFLMKGTDDAGLCFEGQELGKQMGVNNWLIYRVSTAGQVDGNDYDVPDYAKSPKEAAQAHWNITVAKWPRELDKSVVWMEPINEPRAKASPDDIQWENMHPTDWLGEFMLEYAKIANDEGYKVCGPSFNSGEPEVFTGNAYELPGMLAYLRYCAANPDKAALSVHEYTWDREATGEKWADWYPHLWGRVEAAMAASDKHGIPRDFAIFVTEWGFAPSHAPRWPECEPHLTAYNQWAARWPQIKGVAAWTLQNGWGGVDNDLQSWFAPLADYTLSRQFDAGEQPARTHASLGSTVPGQPKPKGIPASNGYRGPQVDFVAGIHGPGDAFTWHDGGFQGMIGHLGMAVKFMSDGDRANFYGRFRKPELDLVRVFWKPDPNRQKTAREAWDEDIRDGVMNFYNQGARNFEVHNEPRLGKEGLGHQWQDGAEFGSFLRQLMLIIKENCPEARLWYPGESPGVPWTNQFAFSRPAYQKVADLCDGICQHAYSGETADVNTAVNEIVGQVRKFRDGFLVWDKPIIVSECSVNRAATPEFRAKVYSQVSRELRQIPGVKGVFWYVSHWNAPENERANAESWYGTPLPDLYKQLNS